MTYNPDPGGNFRSDVHRRIAGYLPLPGDDPASVAALYPRVTADPFIPIASEPELTEVLESLQADELALPSEGAWKQTEAGHTRLAGPIADEPPPLEGAALEAAEAADQELAEEEGAIIAQAKAERVERLKAELMEAEADV